MAVISRALETLFEMLPGHVRIADASGLVVRSNRQAIADDEALARTRDHGRPIGRDDAPLTLRTLWERERPARSGASSTSGELSYVESPGLRALAGIAVEAETLRVQRNGRAMTVEATALPIRDDEGVVIGVLLVEQDAVARADGAAKTEQIAQDHQYMSTAAKLAAGITHDFNNALNPIMSAAFLLEHNAESPEKVRDYAERIREAAESGAEMTARVARFVRQDPLHAGGGEQIDLSRLVNETLHEFEKLAAGDVDARHELHASPRPSISVVREIEEGVQVEGLRDDLRVALRNVALNAVEAMQDGGALLVRVRSDGENATVTFEDSGAGMSEHVRARALEPYYSTKGSAKSGMGLAETYGILRRHGGTVTLHSSPAGCTVTLRLPRAGKLPVIHSNVALESGATRVRDASDGANGANGASVPLHVLVVEDDDAGRELLRRILRTEGHSVDTAANCGEARERLAVASESPYHVMLTDVSLPDGSGWELAAYAREHAPALRIGVITGWEQETRPESGAVEFVLRKPLRANDLLALIAGRTTSTTIGP